MIQIIVSLFLLFGLCAGDMILAQQTGILAGRVTDKATGDGLPGVNIIIQNTGRGASTGPGGDFELAALPAGEYSVLVSHLGYESIETQIVIRGGETTTLDAALHAASLNLSEVLVEARRPFSTASSSAVRQFDLRIRPNRSAHEMLQLAPGLVIAQHAGGGKAEQIFLRGFDADHGTDVAVFADGIPVNMVSHGHGQGYADLHFLIPEIVQAIDVYKGPYFARFGNLATAGAVAFETRDHIEHNSVQVQAGEFNTRKLTTVFEIPIRSEHQGAYFAGQFYDTDGPVLSEQNFQRFNLFGKFHTHLGEQSRIAFSAAAFSSAWNASGQIPQRAVARGLIDRFGAIDDLEGGTTSRQNLNLIFNSNSGAGDFEVQTYASRYNFKLFSNFTFFLDDPANGDMIEQTDERNVIGLNSSYRVASMLGPVYSNTTVGGGFRADDVSVALWHSPDRQRRQSCVAADIFERNLFLWLQQEFVFSPKLRLQLGLRGDYFTFNVEDKLENADAGTDLPHASGYAQDSILNPKANLAFSPSPELDLYANFGSGFHSNDARDVIIAARMRQLARTLERRGLSESEIAQELAGRNFVPEQQGIATLPRALGAELGVRTRFGQRLVLGLAGWWLRLDEELVFVGDEGTTEISGKTRRVGIDVEARLQLLPWLWADADINLSRGKAIDEPDDADEIPLAPRVTSTGGLSAIHPSGVEGSLRYRHIGDRPANEFDSVTARGYTVVDLNLNYHLGRVKLLAHLQNIFDTQWNEAQFDTESRLPAESEPVSEIHFTPGNPRNVQFGLAYEF